MEDKYVEAAEIFLRAAQMSFNFNLLRFNASEFLFFSLICHVAMGQVEKLEEKLLQYQSLDITFLDSNYHLFIVNIVDAIKRNDIDGFADHLYNFDSVVQLEPWCLRALQGIPAKIENCILISKNLELADAAESANESCEQLEQSKIEKCSVQVQPEGVEVQHEKDIEVNPEKEVLELKLSNFEKIKMKLQNIFFNEGNDDGYEMESKLSSNSSGSLYDSFEMTN